MAIKFGTDGVRGVANQALRPEDAFAIGLAAGRLLKEQGATPQVVIGRDTRRSGTMLGAALAAGFCSAGVDVTSLEVAPTGAMSFIARTGEYGMGAVISASHNPAEDNGIKLIAHDGKKISDSDEARVIELMGQEFATRPIEGEVGEITASRDELDRYMDFLESLVPERFEGMTLAIDGAHGAGYELGIEIFRRLGASVVVLGDAPDGMNINAEGGATKPETIQDLTQSSGAVAGIAYDGDADRAVFSDSRGRLVNGDRTMAIWASHWRQHGGFEPPIIVGTVMSNGGFASYASSNGIQLERADVGDKYVSRRMVELGAIVGGEQSGHIIFAERGPTGDGLVTALELMRVLKRERRDLASFYDEFENYPQLLVNVKVARKEGWEINPTVNAAIQQAAALVAPEGRLNVRASGTQPMIRVMGEAPEASKRDEAVDLVANTLLAELGGEIYSRVDLTHALGD